MYTLSIDLGTTYTAAAILDDSGVPRTVTLGRRAPQVPSVLYVEPDGTFLFGEAAENQRSSDPTRFRREIKRRIGDTEKIFIADALYSVADLTGRQLRWIVDLCAERYAGPPTDVVLTHPASWQTAKLDVLRAAAERAEIPSVRFCPEPVAAATYYASQRRVPAGASFCIYDLGGGTFDVCVVTKEADSFRILGEPQGIDKLGGVDFDDEVRKRVLRDLVDLPLDPADPGLYEMREQCIKAKEQLSEAGTASIDVVLAGQRRSVILTRAELEDMIGPRIDETVQATVRALNSAGVRSADLTSIVLVGGSSRIPLVAERLTAAFRCPVTKDTDPKYDIALGAVLTTATGLRTAESVDSSPAGKPADGLFEGTKHHDRRSLTRIIAVSAAVVTAVVLGVTATKLLSSTNSSATDSNTSLATSSPVDPTTGSASIAPSGAIPGTTNGSAASSTLPSSSAPAPTLPAVPAPASFDETSIWWFTTLCRGGADIAALDIPPGTKYPGMSAMLSSYQHSFEMQASVAQSTAAALRARLPATLVDGRIDAQASVDGMQNLSGILTGAAQSVQALTPSSGQNAIELINEIRSEVAASSASEQTDLIQLTTDEMAFVGSLRGCGNVG